MKNKKLVFWIFTIVSIVLIVVMFSGCSSLEQAKIKNSIDWDKAYAQMDKEGYYK